MQVDPNLAGKTPDFSAVCRGVKVLVECTVVQDSDARIGTTKMEDSLKDIIDSAYTGPFDLIWQTCETGSRQPSARRLRKQLSEWAESITHQEAIQSFKDGGSLKSWVWSDEGWKIAFYLGSINHEDGHGAIGAEVSQVLTVETDLILWNALERKADKYKAPQAPYIIMIGDNTSMMHSDLIWDALLGRKFFMPGDLSQGRPDIQGRKFDRLFGSPSKPVNRHVSAILYGRFQSVWSVCGSEQQWQLWHHPEAENPLPHGLFPFTLERFFEEDGRPSVIESSCTLNGLLGLPNPWPGNDH